MKHFFLLLLIIPNLIYASFYSKDFQKVLDKISTEWRWHEELIQQFNSLKLEEKERNIALLNEAIACCERAIVRCDYILDKISHKSKEDRKEWKKEKQQIQQNKDLFHKQIEHIRALIHHTLHVSKASELYQESMQKANLANFKVQECDPRLNNVEEVVFRFNEAAYLYEEALSLAHHALNLISSFQDEESKHVLRQAIEHYQAAANQYKQEATNWPEAIVSYKAALKECIVALKEDSMRLSENGLYHNAYEVQMEIATLLEQLIEGSTLEEAEVFQEELAEVKATLDNLSAQITSEI